MGKDVILIGAGGHAKVISEIVELSGDTVIGYLDDRDPRLLPELNVLGRISKASSFAGEAFFVMAIGDNYIRKKIDELFQIKWYTAQHPSAEVSKYAEIGNGTVIMANAVINHSAKIGRHCIINTASIIEHDCRLHDYVHISPSATLGGTVTIGKCTHIGLGANIINNIAICKDCIIGAGAVVIKDINENGTYVGVPAKKILSEMSD